MRTTALAVTLLLALGLGLPARAAAQAPQARSLADLVALADQRNPQIAAVRQAVAAAEARLALARAGRGVIVTASSTTGTAGGGSQATTPGFSASVSVTTTYVLYDSGQIQHAIRQAEANLQAARFGLDATRQDVALSVATGYINVLRAERSVQLREAIVAQNQELLRQAEGQFRAGVVPRADVVRAQANLAAAEGELVAARNAVEQSRAALNLAVGQSPTTAIALAAPPPAPPVTLTLTALTQFIEERAEVRRGAAEIAAAEAAVAVAEAGSNVRVTVDGRVTRFQVPNETTTYSVSTTATLPVNDAGRVKAQILEAKANLEAAKARIETVRLTVHQQSVQAFLSLLDARARIASARAALEFAQESLRLAQGRYAAGAGPILEVTDAQTALISARVALDRAEYDEIAATLSLRHAIGRSVVAGAL